LDSAAQSASASITAPDAGQSTSDKLAPRDPDGAVLVLNPAKGAWAECEASRKLRAAAPRTLFLEKWADGVS
jgi:hypothetical protein